MKLTKNKNLWIPDKENFFKGKSERYEQKYFLYSMQHIRSKNVALDIGAHIGVWSKRLVNLFDVVIAFEPVPEHVECWRENVTNNKASVNQVALSNIENNVEMGVIEHHGGLSTLEYKFKKGIKKIPIKTKTLDSYSLDRVDFMKIDVEGHEVKVLEGAVDTIVKNSPVIFIEIHKKEREKNKNGYNFLINLGYEEIENFGANFLFVMRR